MTRFSARASDYAKYRPGYPAGVIEVLGRECNLGPSSAVADIGSGTGIFTAQLLQTGCTVHAVEPNGPMRQAAEERLCVMRGFISVDGKAEATTLADASMDLVTAAQAFHWFDREAFARECRRILKPRGFAALIWNDRDDAASPYMHEFNQFVSRHAIDRSRVDHRLVGPDDFLRFFGHDPALHVFHNQQLLNFDSGIGRLGSVSYMPARGQAGYDAMVADYRTLFDAHAVNGKVTILYKTEVHLGRLA